MTVQMLSFFGFILEFIGHFMVGYTAIRVHHRFWQEHKVDDKVFEEMRSERNIGIFGLILMIVGFSMILPGVWPF